MLKCFFRSTKNKKTGVFRIVGHDISQMSEKFQTYLEDVNQAADDWFRDHVDDRDPICAVIGQKRGPRAGVASDT